MTTTLQSRCSVSRILHYEIHILYQKQEIQSGKSVLARRKSLEKSDFLGFYLYLRRVIDDLACFYCSTKTSEKSDRVNFRTTFCCLETYKES